MNIISALGLGGCTPWVLYIPSTITNQLQFERKSDTIPIVTNLQVVLEHYWKQQRGHLFPSAWRVLPPFPQHLEEGLENDKLNITNTCRVVVGNSDCAILRSNEDLHQSEVKCIS